MESRISLDAIYQMIIDLETRIDKISSMLTDLKESCVEYDPDVLADSRKEVIETV